MSTNLTTIIIPVRNEEKNIAPLVSQVQSALYGALARVVFVDDSDDLRTARAIDDARRQYGSKTLRVRRITRPESRQQGQLASAMVDGLHDPLTGEFVVVMAGDLQHPAAAIPEMLAKLTSGKDLVVASRYHRESTNESWFMRQRLVARSLAVLAHVLFPWALRGLTDPSSGFFAFRREAVYASRLQQSRGFLPLLEILVNHPRLDRGEIACHFSARRWGQGRWDESIRLSLLWRPIALRIKTVAQWLVFTFGGVTIALLGIGLFWLLVHGGVEPAKANPIELLSSLVLAFGLCRCIIWRTQPHGALMGQMLLFIIARGVGLLLTWMTYVWLVRRGMNYQLANIVSLPVGAPLGYWTARLIFERRAEAWFAAHRTDAAVAAVVLALVWCTALGLRSSTGNQGANIASNIRSPFARMLVGLYDNMASSADQRIGPTISARQLMWLVAMMSTVLVYALARQLHCRHVFAAVAALIFGLSPLSVGLHQMILTDNLAIMLVLAGLLFVTASRTWVGAAGGVVCLTMATLTKEASILFAPVVLWLLWRHATGLARRWKRVGAFVVAYAAVCSGWVCFLRFSGRGSAAKGYANAIGSTWYRLTGRATSGSVLELTDSTKQSVHAWFGTDPTLLWAGLAVGLFALFNWRLRPFAVMLGILAGALLVGNLPEAFIVEAIPMMALLIGAVSDAWWSRVPARRSARHAGEGRGWPHFIGRVPVVAAAIAAVVFASPMWAQSFRAHTTELPGGGTTAVTVYQTQRGQ